MEMKEDNIKIEEDNIKWKKTIFQETRTCVHHVIPTFECDHIEMCKKTIFQDTRACVHVYGRTV
jgi:hypothetical protein